MAEEKLDYWYDAQIRRISQQVTRIFSNFSYAIGYSEKGEYILRKKLRFFQRKRCVNDFASAQLIGVLFKTDNYNDFQKVKEFLHYLRTYETKIIALCYIDTKKIPDYYLLVKGFNFFTRKSLNIFYIPQHKLVSDFIDQPFDILLDLSMDNCFPIKYISILSKAKFKIGLRQLKYEHEYDLMIDLKKKNISELIENIKMYIPIFAGKYSSEV